MKIKVQVTVTVPKDAKPKTVVEFIRQAITDRLENPDADASALELGSVKVLP